MIRPQPDTGALVRAAQSGDADAQKQLFEGYYAEVWRLAWMEMRDYEDARDSTQKVFEQIFKNLDQFDQTCASDPDRAFASWIFGITKNTCRDALRRARTRARHTAFSLDAAHANGVDIADDQQSLTDHILANTDQQCVQQAVAALPPILRTPIILRYRHNLRYAEIALRLDVPVGTVKSRLNTAIQKLRAILEKERYELPN